MEHISETILKLNLPSKQLQLQEILDSYSHVELTDDEILEAMIWAKRRKMDVLQLEEFKKFQEENRKLMAMKWDFDIIRTYMVNRAKNLFKGKFYIDENNENLFNLLCHYFIEDEESFTMAASKFGVKNPSVKKGILIPGNYGSGKTWMMKLFSRNARQSFDIIPAKNIAQEYLNSKEKEIPDYYVKPLKNHIDVAYPSAEVFNQQYLGVCIDDLGSEEVKNNFGNKANVIGDLIESRYAHGYSGVFLHATTNLAADGIKNFYGERVASRMREIFNIIELKGGDRRK